MLARKENQNRRRNEKKRTASEPEEDAVAAVVGRLLVANDDLSVLLVDQWLLIARLHNHWLMMHLLHCVHLLYWLLVDDLRRLHLLRGHLVLHLLWIRVDVHAT
jgi:hypothetical protein